MTAIKNGIKTTLRTPGKTLLFTLILTALAVLLSVAFCVYTAVRNYLKDCDEYYHTIVTLEFIGKDYPDLHVYDEAMVSAVNSHAEEFAALRNMDETIRFEPSTHALAEVQGLLRTDKLTYDPEAAVFYVYVMGFDDNGGSYLAAINRVLYSRANVNGKLIMMRTASMESDDAPVLRIGESYLVCGNFFTGTSSYLSFLAKPMTLPLEEGEVIVPERTRTDELTPELEDRYHRLADLMSVRNNSCTVQLTAAVDDLAPFHQQELTLRSGRLFEEGDYSSKAKVCIISNRIADALSVDAGDSINISMRTAEGDLYSVKATGSEYESYLVVGVYDRNDDYPACIFIPDASAGEEELVPCNGYRLGTYRIKNNGATAFLEAAKPLEQHGFRFTAYDQGYSSVVEPMRELMLICIIFLAVCLALTAAALSLQCHIFITRQRDAAATMYALGSGRAHIYRYFLSAAAVLALPAAVLGCIIGRLTERTVFGMLERFAEQLVAQDLRFSSSRLTLIRTLEFTPHVTAAVYIAAGAALLLGIILFTLLFSRRAMDDRTERKKRKSSGGAVRRPVRSSSKLSGRLKYAALSIRRNTGRTAAVLLLCLLVALFLGRLTSSLEGFRAQLASVREGAVIKGHATDYFGRAIDGLVINEDMTVALMDPEVLTKVRIANVQRSINWGNLRFAGIPVTADGVEHDIPEPYIPEGSFAIETMVGQMYDEPKWICTNSPENSTLFYYTKPISFVWAEGYDAAVFAENDRSCVMPRQLMEANGICLGDTVTFIYCRDGWLGAVDLHVVGSYLSAAGDETIFSPLPRGGYGRYRQPTYESMTFTLDDAEDLDALRDALEGSGFTWVRSGERGRSFAVIDDEVYLNTTRSMERQIKYVSILYNALYVLAGIIGFVLAWLLASSRRKEIAVMRALGTQPVRIVLNFLAEQALLGCVGLLLGLLIHRLLGQPFGSLLYILLSIHRQAYAALAEPE